ncbi:MAG: hypothetical protein KTR18_07195 [Acidiferrobacterales bacterium]|nr:hypothetical protein [Acidiferrobacterales bacterium]
MMNGRGKRIYYRRDNGKAITSEDIYHMVMLQTYQRVPVHRIAKKFAIKTIEARTLIGRRACGSCCG